MADFGFVGSAYSSPSIYQDCQECINWFSEIDATKEDAAVYPQMGEQRTRGVVALYPTPGYSLIAQLAIGEVRALYTFSGGDTLLAVSGSTVYSINSSFVLTIIGSLYSSSGIVSISDNGIAAMIVDGDDRYSWVKSTNIFAAISPADGPFQGASVVDIVDNFFIYNSPGSQQFGASNELSTSSPVLSFSSKNGAPDNLKSLIISSREVYLLGEITGECWINTGTFPFPLSRIPGTNHQFGCAAEHTVKKFATSFAWLSKNDRGQALVMMMNGYAPIRISTHSIENDLVGQKIDDALAYTYQIEGHEMYVLIFPSANKTWVFDLSTQQWHKWLSWDSNSATYYRHRSNCHIVFQGLNLIGDFSNGAIYQLNKTIFTDNGSTIRRLRRAPHLVEDFQRMYHEELQIQFQPGVGLDNGSDPQCMLRWSNDGSSTWSNEHWISIGKIGNYRNRAIQRRLGWARDRVYEVVVTDPINAVIISANLKVSGGEN